MQGDPGRGKAKKEIFDKSGNLTIDNAICIDNLYGGMVDERNKMREFLGKLWMNPALQKTTIEKKENQVLVFLKENQGQLQKIFSQQEFFPNLSWNDAIKLLLTELVDKLLESISPKLDFISQNILSPSVLREIDPNADIEVDKFKDFIVEQMKTKAMRDQYLSSVQIISLNYINNYIPPVIERHKYIYNELVRHDRLKMDTPLIISYLNLVALFRPVFYYPVKLRDDAPETVSLSKLTGDKKTYDMVLEKVKTAVDGALGRVPANIFTAAIDSNLSLGEFPQISGSSKFIAALAARSADYIPMEKRDRGAESPDKSWFQINRRNAKIYGLDPDLLDELYQIAGEKGW